jgi:ribosomal protein L11 methyltransferase
MSDPTFELTLVPASQTVKAELMQWLRENGVDSFVEGAVDNIWVDPSESQSEQFAELGGEDQPLVIYKFDREFLTDLEAKVAKTFGSQVRTAFKELDTAVWQEGWKASFKPFVARQFYVYPPWEKGSCPVGCVPIEIEPGMAFGTGQHATTRLCLEAVGDFADKIAGRRDFLDIGTGTGILAIAAAKLGFDRISGTDVDVDALRAARANAEVNGVQADFCLAKDAQNMRAKFVCANILAVTLIDLVDYVARTVENGGYLVLSGILVDEHEGVVRCYRNAGLSFVERRDLDDWTCLIFKRS